MESQHIVVVRESDVQVVHQHEDQYLLIVATEASGPVFKAVSSKSLVMFGKLTFSVSGGAGAWFTSTESGPKNFIFHAERVRR